jgi:hypothetical protein
MGRKARPKEQVMPDAAAIAAEKRKAWEEARRSRTEGASNASLKAKAEQAKKRKAWEAKRKAK